MASNFNSGEMFDTKKIMAEKKKRSLLVISFTMTYTCDFLFLLEKHKCEFEDRLSSVT